MFKNNLKIAFRSLKRYQLYTFINVLGMGFGIACFLFIALYAIDELTFDGMHQKGDHIYRVVQHQQLPNTKEQHFGAVSFNASEAAKNEIPGVKNAVKMLWWGRTTLRVPDAEEGHFQTFWTAENSFFEIFDFKFIEGNPQTALSAPNSIVLTQSLAKKFFGDANPMGKIIRSDRGMDLKVTALLEDVPNNGHLQFESLISHQTIASLDWFNHRVLNDWSSQSWATYLVLEDTANPNQIGTQLTNFAKARATERRPFEGTLALQALKDIHFGSEGYTREANEGKSTYRYLYLFSLIGLFILGIACINYINLATARAGNYSREVGVRKAVGAGKLQLFSRFLAESLMLTGIAFLLGLGLVQFALPWFNDFTGKALTLNPSNNYWILPTLFLFIILIGILAGSYPASYFARFDPAKVLKGNWKLNLGGQSLRKSLVVLQFALSILMIIGTLVVWKQLNYVQGKSLGFDEEQLMVIDINSGKVRRGFEIIKNRYAQLPEVQVVSVSSRVPGEWKNLVQAEVRAPNAFDQRGEQPWFLGVDEDFIKTFDITLESGRNFEHNRQADSTAIIINRSAAELFGIQEANEQEVLVMSRINQGSERALEVPLRARIIGITNDFNFQSLYNKVEPLVLGYRNNPIQSIDYFTAKISGNNVEKTIAQMTDILHEIDSEQMFEYHFLDQQIQQFYEADARRGQLFTIAALCAIFIACLGLFGLATFMAAQKAKEISIRKILGASVTGIIALLSKDFLKLVGIALFIAAPLGWYFMEQWLTSFAYRIDLQWWIFALAGLIALSIAFLTVGYQSIRAAIANPVKALKSE